MEYKPWPLLILAFFHFIEPLSKIVFYSVYFNVNPLDAVVIEYQMGSALHVFEYFFLFPIAGLALFAVKKWSFSVFVVVEIWVFLTNLPYLNELYETSQLWLLGFFILFGIVNIVVVSYLLLPAVRIAYLDPRIRWWEAKPRYFANIETKVDGQATAIIKNISKSGVFIALQKDVPIDSEIHLEFTLATQSPQTREFHIKLKALVVHKFFIDGTEGYGARFSALTTDNKQLVNSMIKYLEKSNTERRPARRHVSDFINWLTTLITTGKGLFPQNRLNTLRK